MQNKPRENKLENDSPIQININISAGNGRINGAREFADLLCSKRLRVTGYRIRFTQKRNDKKTVLVEANYRTIGTIDIMKGFVFVSSVDGSKKVMYGSPDREFPDSEQVLSVMFHDVFGINTEIARVENGVLNTSDIELAQRIVNFYSDFVERMVAPVDYIDENGNRKNLVEKIRTGIVRIGEEGFIKIRVGRLAINRGAKRILRHSRLAVRREDGQRGLHPVRRHGRVRSREDRRLHRVRQVLRGVQLPARFDRRIAHQVHHRLQAVQGVHVRELPQGMTRRHSP